MKALIDIPVVVLLFFGHLHTSGTGGHVGESENTACQQALPLPCG